MQVSTIKNETQRHEDTEFDFYMNIFNDTCFVLWLSVSSCFYSVKQ